MPSDRASRAPRPADRAAWLGLALALALAAVLRLPFPANGLPQAQDPDSAIVTQAVAMEAIRLGGQARVQTTYPLLLAKTLDVLPGRLAVEAPRGSSLDEHLAAAAHPYVVGRLWVALLACLTVPATWFLARRFVEPRWATLAALLVATSLLHLVLSRQARPHAPLTAFVTWTLVASVRMAERDTWGSILACAFASALAVATLHNGPAALLAVLAAALFVARRGGWRRVARLWPIPLAVLAAVALAYPFVFEGGGGRHSLARLTSMTLDGSGFAKVPRSFWAYDPTLVVLGVVGAASLIRGASSGAAAWCMERGRAAAVVAAFALPYLVVIGLYYRTTHRFALPLLPILAVLAAFGTRQLARAAARRLPALSPRAAAAAVGSLVALFPTATAGRLALLFGRPHGMQRAAAWVVEHLDPATDVLGLSYRLDLPLGETRETARRTPRVLRSPWQEYILEVGGLRLEPEWSFVCFFFEERSRADADRLAPQEVARIVRENGVTHGLVIVPRGARARFDGAREAMVSLGGTLVARFDPYSSAALSGYSGGSDQLDFEALRYAWTAKYLGPVIEIYRLGR